MLSVLVVEDDSTVREACDLIATDIGFEVRVADSLQAARLALEAYPIDIVLLDLRLGSENGLALLEHLQVEYSQITVIVMTAFATVGSAVVALRAGAFDYIQKPFTVEELTSVLESAAHRPLFNAEAGSVQEDLPAARSLLPLADRSPAMEKISRIVSKIAFASHPVLIVGEPGTGKEVVARSIHLNGPNSSSPFVPIACGSLSEDAIEEILFGPSHRELIPAGDPTTGALFSTPGSTIFLDEIGSLSLPVQTRLLRVLEEKRLWTNGTHEACPMTARILASSTCELDERVKTGQFRRDLFLRLNVVNLRLPPLRERKVDIPVLSAHILDRVASESKRKYRLGKSAIRPLMEYDWPGNVRELEHAIEYACVISSGAELHLCDFPKYIQDHNRADAVSLPFRQDTLDNLVELDGEDGRLKGDVVVPMAEIEKKAILNTLRQLRGDKLLAAKLLGIGKTTLYRKLREYELDPEEW
jgi:two-component system response regulator HydG